MCWTSNRWSSTEGNDDLDYPTHQTIVQMFGSEFYLDDLSLDNFSDEIHTKVENIRLDLSMGLVVAALDGFDTFLSEYNPSDYLSVQGLLQDHQFAANILHVFRCAVKRIKLSVDDDCHERNLLLSLEAFQSIVKLGYGAVFGNVTSLIPDLITQIMGINSSNQNVVQRSLDVICTMMKDQGNLLFETGQEEEKTSIYAKLIELNLFQVMDHVSRLLQEEIATSRRNGDNPTKEVKMLMDSMLAIVHNFIQEMAKVNEWEEEGHIKPIDLPVDWDLMIVLLFRIFCIDTHGDKESPHLAWLISFSLKMYKDDIECKFGPSLNLLKDEGTEQDLTILRFEPVLGKCSLKSCLLPYFRDLLDRDRSKDIQLNAIAFLELLPYEVVVKQGIFYPLLDLVVGAVMEVRCKVLNYLRVLVEYGPSEIMVLATTDVIERITSDMIMDCGGELSHNCMHLIRKLFQRADRFNAIFNLIVPVTAITNEDMIKTLSKEDSIVGYMKKKLAMYKDDCAIFYTWYWKDDFMYRQTEWLATHIYSDVDWTSHTMGQAFTDWETGRLIKSKFE